MEGALVLSLSPAILMMREDKKNPFKSKQHKFEHKIKRLFSKVETHSESLTFVEYS